MSEEPIDARDESTWRDDRNLPGPEWAARSPHTTLILACYRVERYLPEFLASLDAQTADHSGYELIFVIDGCPERSEAVVREWAADTDYAVRVIVKGNGGVASARNAGLDRARGAWITSPDPDDRLAPDYLARIEEARAAHPGERMFVGRIRLLDPERREVRHPLDFKYRDGERRIVDLRETPDDIQTLGGVVFFDAARLRAHGQRVREDLPTASDADFIMRYLLLNGARYVLVPAADYLYQRRVDASSIVKTQERNIERFTTVFGVTHRDLLAAAGDDCPQWLANTLLYFTNYLFRRNRLEDSPVYGVDQGVLDRIRAELTENLRRIGAERIAAFRIVDLPVETRLAWTLAARPGLRRSPVELHAVDPADGTLRAGVFVEEPGEPAGLRVTGTDVLETKVRRVEYLGSTWLFERLLRLAPAAPETVALGSDGGFGFELGGRPLPAREIRARLGQRHPAAGAPSGGDRPRGGRARPGAAALRRRLGGLRRVLGRLRLSVPLRLAAATGASRRYAGAWVLSDAEGLAPWLPELCRGLDAAAAGDPPVWYVAERGARRRALAGVRAVRRGSARHFVLMKHARVLASTGLSRAERQPFPPEVLAEGWRRVHLPVEAPGPRAYRRLNPAPVDAIVAADEAERDRYAADGGDYRFLPSEVLLLPGFRGGTVAASDARAVLAASAAGARGPGAGTG